MHTLIIFLPGRRRPGSLAVAAKKYELILLEGAGEAEMRAEYVDRVGALLTVTGFEARAGEDARRASLPPAVIRWVEEAAAAHQGPPIEIALIEHHTQLKGRTRITAEHIERPLILGHRYLLGPVGPEL